MNNRRVAFVKIIHSLCLYAMSKIKCGFGLDISMHHPSKKGFYTGKRNTTSKAILNRCFASRFSLAPGLCKSLYKLPLDIKIVK